MAGTPTFSTAGQHLIIYIFKELWLKASQGYRKQEKKLCIPHTYWANVNWLEET